MCWASCVYRSMVALGFGHDSGVVQEFQPLER
jgi:hypothetical protein